jgi:hypothetical protein
MGAMVWIVIAIIGFPIWGPVLAVILFLAVSAMAIPIKKLVTWCKQ